MTLPSACYLTKHSTVVRVYYQIIHNIALHICLYTDIEIKEPKS